MSYNVPGTYSPMNLKGVLKTVLMPEPTTPGFHNREKSVYK